MKNLKLTRIIVISCLFLLIIADSANAKTTNFNIFNKRVSFDIPADWQTIDKEVGIPLKLLGPMHEDRRPVILLVPIDLKDEKLVLGDKVQAAENYKIGRLAWLQTFNGKSISFLPLVNRTLNDKKIEVFQFGHLYNLDNANFEEKSYLIRCKNQTFHIKSLIQIEHITKWSTAVKTIIDSFKCE